jgi:hypothetical protein
MNERMNEYLWNFDNHITTLGVGAAILRQQCLKLHLSQYSPADCSKYYRYVIETELETQAT